MSERTHHWEATLFRRDRGVLIRLICPFCVRNCGAQDADPLNQVAGGSLCLQAATARSLIISIIIIFVLFVSPGRRVSVSFSPHLQMKVNLMLTFIPMISGLSSYLLYIFLCNEMEEFNHLVDLNS